MGWQRLEFTNDTILVWHNGAIDGTSYMAFLPQHDLGIVVLNNMNFAPTGIGFYIYMVTLLLNQHCGLNHDVTETAPSSATPVSTGCGSWAGAPQTSTGRPWRPSSATTRTGTP